MDVFFLIDIVRNYEHEVVVSEVVESQVWEAYADGKLPEKAAPGPRFPSSAGGFAADNHQCMPR